MREIVLASAMALTAVCAVVPRVMAQQDSTTQMNVYYDEYQPTRRRINLRQLHRVQDRFPMNAQSSNSRARGRWRL